MSLPVELFDYLSTPDACYSWDASRVAERSGITEVDLHLTSQLWQGHTWTHRMHAFVPAESSDSGLVLLYILDSRPQMETELGRHLAMATGLPTALLYDVPNQPLFDDLVEDALIAHTFVRYLDTLDPTWPLLLPMVKSVKRAMDALQELAARNGVAADRFLVMGASKRGWTTWLTAATDQRVAAIAPMVYDNLNIPAQLAHQIEAAGAYSDEISDYTERGLPARMRTPEGQHLARIVDPYTYREHLALPKLILNGSNDPYWMTDALNLYWGDLSGEKHVLYIPNAGHGLYDAERLFGAVRAFARAKAAGASLPELAWNFQPNQTAVSIRLDLSEDAVGAQCWVARAEGRDFRAATWVPTRMKVDPAARSTRRWHAEIPRPRTGSMAVFAEFELEQDGHPYRLSTQVCIVP
jgi:PhoPQ-activated pathogenicity-related protein